MQNSKTLPITPEIMKELYEQCQDLVDARVDRDEDNDSRIQVILVNYNTHEPLSYHPLKHYPDGKITIDDYLDRLRWASYNALVAQHDMDTLVKHIEHERYELTVPIKQPAYHEMKGHTIWRLKGGGYGIKNSQEEFLCHFTPGYGRLETVPCKFPKEYDAVHFIVREDVNLKTAKEWFKSDVFWTKNITQEKDEDE